MLRLIVFMVATSLLYSSSHAGVITIGGILGAPNLNTSNQTVKFEVTAIFQANPGESFEPGFLSGFAIDVGQSSVMGASISTTSFDSFSFDANSSFASWDIESDFGETFTTGIPFPITWGPSTMRIEAQSIPDEISIAGPTTISLGFLEFDYSGFGLVGGDSFTVNIEGDINVIPTSASFVPNDFGLPIEWVQPLDFESLSGFGPAEQTITLPLENTVVPEPASIAIWGLLGLGLVGARRKKRKSA